MGRQKRGAGLPDVIAAASNRRAPLLAPSQITSFSWLSPSPRHHAAGILLLYMVALDWYKHMILSGK